MSDNGKLSRRKLVKVSGASLAAALVAGCGGNGGGEGGTTTGEGTTPGGEETTAETETAETGTAETETAETGTAETETAASTAAQSYVLGGEQSGWKGREPATIAEETNPTLSMVAGRTYEITWENLDGMEHELIIETESGEQLAATESTTEQGATRSLTFEATSEAASYYCEYHPESMRGEIMVSQPGTETVTETAATTTSS